MCSILRALAERHRTHIFSSLRSVITRFTRQMWNLRILFCVFAFAKLSGMCTFFYLTHLFAFNSSLLFFRIRFKTARLFKFFFTLLLVYSKLSCFGFCAHESQCDAMKIDAQSLALSRSFVCIIHKKRGFLVVLHSRLHIRSFGHIHAYSSHLSASVVVLRS